MIGCNGKFFGLLKDRVVAFRQLATPACLIELDDRIGSHVLGMRRSVFVKTGRRPVHLEHPVASLETSLPAALRVLA